MNKVILIGNLGKTPELRYSQSGLSICDFSIATNEGKDKVEWHRCVAFKEVADNIAKYCDKGSKVAVDGKLNTNVWNDKEGVTHYQVEIIVNFVEFLTPKTGNNNQSEQPKVQAKKNKTDNGVREYVDEDVPF